MTKSGNDRYNIRDIYNNAVIFDLLDKGRSLDEVLMYAGLADSFIMDSSLLALEEAATRQNLRGFSDTVIDCLKEETGCESGTVRLADSCREHAILVGSRNYTRGGAPFARSLDSGISGVAFGSRTSIYVDDTSTREPYQKLCHAYESTPYLRPLLSHKSMIAAPIFCTGNAMGVIKVYKPIKGGFVSKDKDNFNKIIASAGILFQLVMKREERLLHEKICDFIEKLEDISLDKGQALKNLLDFTIHFTGSRAGTISVVEECGTWFRIAKVNGIHEDIVLPRQKANVGIFGRAISERSVKLIPNAQHNRQFQEYQDYLKSIDTPEADRTYRYMKNLHDLIVIPLFYQNKPFAVVSLHSPWDGIFSPIHYSLLEKLSRFDLSYPSFSFLS